MMREIKNDSLISIVVTVYNTENYLDRCISSILAQSYSNFEIIIVNDGSPGCCDEIVSGFMSKDKRIRYIKNDKNLGLYKSRLVGSDVAEGQFITFVDSDDYVSLDGYRQLIQFSEEKNIDIVCGRTIIHDEINNNKFIYTRNYVSNIHLMNEDVHEAFFRQSGYAYFWHTVWNKVYKKTLWDRCRGEFNGFDEHIVMTEDVAFSSVLFLYAKSFSTIDVDLIFYVKRKYSSTSLTSEFTAIKKNIEDIAKVFDFVDRVLLSHECDENIYQYFKLWKELYGRIWSQNIFDSYQSNKNKKTLKSILIGLFNFKKIENKKKGDDYFYEVESKWDGAYEEILTKVLDGNIKVVSFDIFDTLICRPFKKPEDLFSILEMKISNYTEDLSGGRFKGIRILSENNVRKKLWKKNIKEEVTLGEIYNEISHYGIAKVLSNKIKRSEEELEIKFCRARNKAKSLFDLSVYLNKKIILISDMYLSLEVIKSILIKNGYEGFCDIYLSSEIKLTKSTGSLFKFVINDLPEKKENIIHIGDNWESDIQTAKKCGINNAVYFPKAIDLLFKESRNNKVNAGFNEMKNKVKGIINFNNSDDNILMSVCLGTIANGLFDDPFRSFNSSSDFDSNAEVIGYYPFGMHVLAILKWLISQGIDNDRTIHFVSRDGYSVYLSYCLIYEKFNWLPKPNYLYVSRKSLLPLLIKNYEDFYCIPEFINVGGMTISEFINLMFKRNLSDEELKKFKRTGYNAHDPIGKLENYFKLVNVIKENKISLESIFEYSKSAKEYLSIIKVDDSIFDIGYRATTQYILSTIGIKTNGLYVHTSTSKAYDYARTSSLKINTLYDFSPVISGPIREYIMSSIEPSCVGYKKKVDGDVLPVFDKNTLLYPEYFTAITLHAFSKKFTRDIFGSFESLILEMSCNPIEISLPYEYLLHNPSVQDQKIFSSSEFEDDLMVQPLDTNVASIWNESRIIADHSFNEKTVRYKEFGKLNRVILYLMIDQDVFMLRLKSKMKRNKYVYMACRFIYNAYFKFISRYKK